MAYERAAACLSPDDPNLRMVLHNMGLGYMERYTKFLGLEDIQTAIETMQKGIALTPDEDPALPYRLDCLGTAFSSRFQRNGDPDDIAEAIKNQRHAIRHTPDRHANMPILLNKLGILFDRKFERTGDVADITEAIKTLQRAVELTPDGHATLPSWLNNLGHCFEGRSKLTGSLDDISEAIHILQRAVELTPDGHFQMPSRLNTLGISFHSRFDRTGRVDDITQAINILQRSFELTPDGDAEMPFRLSNLGNAFCTRLERTGDADDISEAIKVLRHAVALLPDGHAEVPALFKSIAFSYRKNFERAGNLDDILQAIVYSRHSVELTQDGHADMPDRLSVLGSTLMCRRDEDDISEAIKLLQRAVELSPDGHTSMPKHLNFLGSAFFLRFQRTGEMGDLIEAIKYQQRSIKLTSDGDTRKPGWLNNLGTTHCTRFLLSEDVDDITEAINAQQNAVKLIPDGHPELPDFLSNLGTSLRRRFEYHGGLDDIDKAIETHQRAVELTPDGHPRMSGRLGDLGLAFFHLSLRTLDVDHINKAIKVYQSALELDPDAAYLLSGLANSFCTRFGLTGDVVDSTEAIKHQQRAVDLTPDGHLDKSARLNDLGLAFRTRFEKTGDPEFLLKAVSSYRSSATSSTGHPYARLPAAIRWARVLRNSPLDSQLLDAHACIIRLLSLVSGMENTVQRRHKTLVKFSQLSMDACAAALSVGQHDKALEWLIEGRCIVWNQISQLRTSADKLRAHDPSLADRFATVSRDLEAAGSYSGSHTGDHAETSLIDYKISKEEQAAKHITLAKEWDQLLITIRMIPGFEDFLQPQRMAEIMRNLPNDGVIVIINIHNDRCDALALMAGADEPMHIPLPKFSYQEAERLAEGFHGHLVHRQVISRLGVPLDSPLPNVDLVEVLSVLWSQVVWPIWKALPLALYVCSSRSGLYSQIDRLQVPDAGSTSRVMPRIWWCPTGPLAFLPIHAAGIYDSNGMPNQCLPDLAVSSYIPTINLLLKKPGLDKRGNAPTGLLIVSQPNTPNKSRLSGAAEESAKVARQLEKRGISSLTLVDQKGTVDMVSKAMESFSCIHLACHAAQNTTNPLESSIYLHDRPFQLSEIMKKNLPSSDFAFLSACQTSTGDRNLPEEVVHLVAGMLAAGYRSAVGTMWSISDAHGPDIAESFYESLLDGEVAGGKIDGVGAARALHHTTQKFRKRFPDSLLVWVPYIHLGI